MRDVYREVREGGMTREEWFRLPLELRRCWWRDTDYGKRAPSPEMIAALNKAGHRAPVYPRRENLTFD